MDVGQEETEVSATHSFQGLVLWAKSSGLDTSVNGGMLVFPLRLSLCPAAPTLEPDQKGRPRGQEQSPCVTQASTMFPAAALPRTVPRVGVAEGGGGGGAAFFKGLVTSEDFFISCGLLGFII